MRKPDTCTRTPGCTAPSVRTAALRTNSLFEELAFNGDRILVNKYPYEFGEPDRFDVFVFKWPKEPQTNYIKRLVGLPGRDDSHPPGEICIGWTVQNEQILRMRPARTAMVADPGVRP
jgi:signal peptidase I